MTKKDVEKVLKQAKPVFEQIDEIGEQLRNRDSLDIPFYYKSLDILTGCYTFLAPRYLKISASKKNGEDKKYMELKLESDDDVKFVSAVANREASSSVADLRMLRNILEGYLNSATTGIQTCRKHIDGYYAERQVTKEQK